MVGVAVTAHIGDLLSPIVIMILRFGNIIIWPVDGADINIRTAMGAILNRSFERSCKI